MPETVLHTICFSEIYGAQKAVLSIVGNLDPSRYRAIVAAPASDLFFSELRGAGAETVPMSFSGLADMKTVAALRSLIKKRGIRIVHAHLGISSFLSLAAAARLPNVSVVCTRHFINDRYTTIQNKFVYEAFRNMYSFMNKRFKKTTFPSEAIRKAVEAREGSLGDRSIVIPNSVRLSDFDQARANEEARAISSSFGLPADRPLVVCVSRLDAEKNVDDLISAAAILKARGVEINFIVIGEGGLRKELEEMIRRNGLEKNFRLPGYISHVGKLLGEADMFVLCAREEPFGISVLEAMAAGAPVICANSGGPAEIIQGRISGLFFQPGDHEGLAEIIKTLAADASLRDSLRHGAFERVALYDVTAIAKRHMDMYDEIARQSR